MAYSWMYFEKNPDYEGTHDEWLLHTKVAMPTFLHYFFSGDMCSVEQVRDRIRQNLTPFDRPLEAELGISASTALDIACWISQDLQAKLDAVSKGQATYYSLLETAKRESWDEGRFEAEVLGNEDVLGLRRNLSSIYRIHIEELRDAFGEKKATAFWTTLRIARGEIDEFRYPTEQNPIEFAPLVAVSDGEALLPVGNILYTAILRGFAKHLTDGPYRESFLSNRDQSLESSVADVISAFFGNGASCYENVFEQSDAQFEHDLIVVIDDHALAVECKASPPREPFRDPRRAYTRFKHAFGSDRGIQHGFDQANRIFTRFKYGEKVSLFDKKGV